MRPPGTGRGRASRAGRFHRVGGHRAGAGRGGAGLGGGPDAHARSTGRAKVRPARPLSIAAAGPLTPRRGEDQDPDKPASPARTRSRGPGDNDQASSSHPQFSLQGILVKKERCRAS